jgi:hypothetical protein
MWLWQGLDYDDFPPRRICEVFGYTPVKTLSHARCNRLAGAKLKPVLKAMGIPPRPRRNGIRRTARPQPKRVSRW